MLQEHFRVAGHLGPLAGVLLVLTALLPNSPFTPWQFWQVVLSTFASAV